MPRVAEGIAGGREPCGIVWSCEIGGAHRGEGQRRLGMKDLGGAVAQWGRPGAARHGAEAGKDERGPSWVGYGGADQPGVVDDNGSGYGRFGTVRDRR